MARICLPITASLFDIGFKAEVADSQTLQGEGTSDAPTHAIAARILALDRSSDDFGRQIKEAASILNFRPGHKASAFSENVFEAEAEAERLHGFGPLEEWLLKWVLRKFKPLPDSHVKLGSPCTYHEAWKLVAVTINRLPSERAASILKVTNFISILQNTLAWLSTSATRQVGPRISVQETTSPSDSSGSSTSGTIRSAPSSSKRPRKKRKHNGTNEVLVQQETYSPYLLYEGIVDSTCAIESLLEHEKDELSQQRYFSKIECSPEIAAKILGDSLAIIYDQFSAFQDRVRKGYMKASRKLVHPIMFIWKHISTDADEGSRRARDQALFTHTLVPSLRILQQCASITSDFASSLIKDFEPFVKSNLIKPLRDTLRQREMSSGAAQHEQDVYIAKLLAPLRSLVAQIVQGIHTEQKSHADLDLVGLLFHHTLTLVSLKSSKDRLAEGPWLRLLFLVLVRYLGLLVPAGNDDVPPLSVLRVLKDMIQSATSRNVSLDVTVLQQFLGQCFKPDRNIVRAPEWELMQLCLAAKPELVLSERIAQPAIICSHGQPSKTLLSTLISFVGNSQPKAQDEDESDIEYADTVLDNFRKLMQNAVLPILKAYLDRKKLNDFLKFWQEQLVLTTDSPAITRDALYRTIWENEKILTIVADGVDASLTTLQITEWFQTLLDDFSESSTSAGRVENGRRARWRSNLLLLDCLLSGIKGQDVVSELQVQGFYDLILNTFMDLLTTSSPLPDLPRWRIWRILTTVTQHLATTPAGLDIIAPYSPFEDLCVQLVGMEGYLYDYDGRWSESYQEKYQVFVYLVNWKITALQPERTHFSWDSSPAFLTSLSDSLNELVEQCEEISDKWGNYALQNEYMCQRKMRKFTCNTLALEYVTWLVRKDLDMRTSNFLNVISPHQLRTLAMSHGLPGDNTKVMTRSDRFCSKYNWSYFALWEEIMSSGILDEEGLVQGSMIPALIGAIDDTWDDSPTPVWNHNLKFTFDALLLIPASAFKASDRVDIVTAVLSKFSLSTRTYDSDGYKVGGDTDGDVVSSDDNVTADNTVKDEEDEEARPHYMDNEVVFQGLKLLLRLTEPLTLDMPLVNSPASLLKHAELFRGYDQLAIFKTLVQRLLTFAVTEMTKLKITKPFHEIAEVAQRKAKPSSAENTINGTKIRSLMVLSFVEEHSQQAESSYPSLHTMLDSEIRICSERLLKLLRRGSSADTRALDLSLDLIASLPNRTLTKFNTQEIQVALKNYSMEQLRKDKPSDLDSKNPDLCTQLYFKLCETDQTILATAFTPWNKFCQERFRALPAKAQAQMLKELLQKSPPRDRSQDLLQFKLCLKHIRDITDDASVELRDLLHRSYHDMANEVRATTSPHSCIILMQCMDYILRQQRSLINQNHVEATLQLITTMTSPRAPTLPTIHTRQFFTGCCQLMMSLLVKHRPKLGVRYHMVAQVLQGLLRCLYTPSPKQRTSVLLPPPWLDRQESPASIDEAEILARMFTMLCNPAPSVVEQSRAELNDATKKARGLAGQHLQPVVEEFCASQLTGSIPLEARDRLMPSVWAVISSMDVAQLRAMNEGFAGAEMRDVWKAVFAEWERARK